MAQLVASVSGVVLGGVAEVVGSNLGRGKMFTASIGSVDSLYPSVYLTDGMYDVILKITVAVPDIAYKGLTYVVCCKLLAYVCGGTLNFS